MEDARQKELQVIASKLVTDLSFVAPEDTGMQQAKIFAALAKVDRPLRAIHEILNGKMWDPDDFDAIADVLESAGFEIEDPT